MKEEGGREEERAGGREGEKKEETGRKRVREGREGREREGEKEGKGISAAAEIPDEKWQLNAGVLVAQSECKYNSTLSLLNASQSVRVYLRVFLGLLLIMNQLLNNCLLIIERLLFIINQ